MHCLVGDVMNGRMGLIGPRAVRRCVLIANYVVRWKNINENAVSNIQIKKIG